MENETKKNTLSELMDTTMSKIHEMVDSNAIVSEPIVTPDGVTVIPISRLSFGFGSGGSDYGKESDKFGGGGGAGVKIDPVAFLIVRNGQTNLMTVTSPATTTVDRIVEMTPQIIDRVEDMINKKKEEKEEKDIF